MGSELEKQWGPVLAGVGMVLRGKQLKAARAEIDTVKDDFMNMVHSLRRAIQYEPSLKTNTEALIKKLNMHKDELGMLYKVLDNKEEDFKKELDQSEQDD